MPVASQIELPERYRVVRHIASGGMATVWEAEDLLLGRIVAVKVLGSQYAADAGARARFQREARTAAQVSDQTNVVTIFDIGEHGDDAFIVMEHFAGGTVADRLRAARDANERVPRATALSWLRQAAAGLDVAHAAGIVHRDVKPANLLLDGEGRLAVADFGIARLVDDTQMTQTGQILGTAAYISPEQAMGLPATAASDRYALAVVAYELLTGRRPFGGGPPTAQALQHARDAPPPASEAAPDLPRAVDTALARGLAKDPHDRPSSAGELVGALESALGPREKVDPTLVFEVPDGVRPARPATPVVLGGAALGEAAAVAAGAAAERERPAPEPGSGAPPADGAAALVAGADAPPADRAAKPAAGAGAPPADRAATQVDGAPREPPGPLPPIPPLDAPVAATPRDDARSPRRRLQPSEPRAREGPRAVAASRPRGPHDALPPARPRRPAPVLLVAALVTAAAVALALVLASGGEPQRSAGRSRQSTQPARDAARTATTAAAAQPPATPAQNASTQGTTPAALNARGYALIKQGRYAEAIAPLQAAVDAYKAAGSTGLPYAYALFNLAVALNRSGRPAEAVPLLRERLGYHDQQAAVQAELDDALAKLGQTAPGAKGKDKPKHKGPKA
ncbi:MAG: eukaryotic-like serine/threonine-protein kinase [Solirubrobacteraceae bacterium]|nr:eukaryotic-like serine/threonine-protein kinase [Solirubrobacteraceae bacterium]